MPPEIRELDAETRDRIAAGEVIERPASVVKELLENALDADAGRIEVTVEAGGIDRIVVSDDGVGMDESAARRAIEQHTTSKLRDVAELESIGTLGFRGEALHAIGAVARLRIETKPRGDAGSRGTELVVEGGDVRSCGPTGCPEGTTVEVTELFGAVPARRKYLKTEATEFDHVARIVTGYALARPDVAISLTHEGREVFATPGDGDRRSAVMAAYGREVAAAMIPVESDGGAGTESGTAAERGPLAGVEGLVSHPETNRAGSEYVTTLVNGRYVRSSAVREAVVDAYGSQLAGDRYPFAVVDLDLPPGGVDVNVHPRKLEVLFSEEAAIKAGVTEAVEDALETADVLRTRAPRGRSAAEQTEVSPGDGGGGFEADPDSDSDPDSNSASNSDSDSDRDRKTTTQERADTHPSAAPDPRTESGDRFPDDGRSERHSSASADAGTDAPAKGSASDPGLESEREQEPESEPAPDGASGATDGPDGTDVHQNAAERAREPAQRTLDGATTTGTPGDFERLPSMTVLGQFDDTYIVAEADDGLVLIDQHAADERVNYERLRAAFGGDVTTQTLAEPVTIGATARELALAAEYGDALARLGFRVRIEGDEGDGSESENDGQRRISVLTVPALLADHAGADAPEVARDLLEEFVDGDPEGTVESVADDVLGDLACHPSITGNTSLREGTVAGLLEALDDCEDPWTCPHGRPVVIHIDSGEIDDRFERDYPGHEAAR